MYATTLERNVFMVSKSKKQTIGEQIEIFLNGDSTNAYEFMGCHKTKNGFVFRVWAPNAKSVSVTGDEKKISRCVGS